MEAIRVSKGETFIKKGDGVRHLYILLQGSVQAVYKRNVWRFEAGSIMGMLESSTGKYTCNYTALTDCVLYAYEYGRPEDFAKIFTEDREYVSVLVMATMRQTAHFLHKYETYYQRAHSYYVFLMEMFQEYELLCQEYGSAPQPFTRIEMAKPFVPEERINHAVIDFYEKMAGLSQRVVDATLGRDISLSVGEMLNGAVWMRRALLLVEEIQEYLLLQREYFVCAKEDNLYHRYLELIARMARTGRDVSPIQEAIDKMIAYARENELYDKEWLDTAFAKYENSHFGEKAPEDSESWEEDAEDESFSGDYLGLILSFAEYEADKGDEFRADLETFKNLTDIYSTTDDVRMMRRRLTRHFFELYKRVFRKSLDKQRLPGGIRMFLNFGFVDAGLAGEDRTKELDDLVDRLFLCKADNVYTMYEWLLSIYRGENEPSRNEFDLDYPAYLLDLKRSGKLTNQQVKENMDDPWMKVEFEMDNVFPATSKMTYGKISSYCPLLHESDVISSAESMLVTAEKINSALDHIRAIDFSVFYRGVVFSDPARDINMEMIQKEVLPNVILLPNTGSRAMMWQETAGVKRDTPARFMFPVLTIGNILELMIEVTGRYRWEICRKIQGVRWNDVTEPSLTSEYSDYIQYYRKNSELSPEAKEKMKNMLVKCKNNYREVFVKDYQSWINYESKGSFRLNKVSRAIIFKYCPFAKNIREELKVNPMYKTIFERYDIMNGRTVRRIEMLYDRYRKKGGEITRDLQRNLDFYDM